MLVLAALFTIFISGSPCHFINLIDGLHGLALGASTITLLGLASISANVGDELMVKICLGGVACISGLFILTFHLENYFWVTQVYTQLDIKYRDRYYST